MAQGGDPTGTGTSGSKLPNLKAEFSREPHVRGTASMARTPDPDSANSQFFICFDDARFLDGQYTVWGQVESGMEHVDALPDGEPPREPGKIVKATVSEALEEGRARSPARRPGSASNSRASCRSAGTGWCSPRAARIGSRSLPKSSGNARAVAIDLSKADAAAKLMADLEANGETSTCSSTMPASD